MLTSLKGKYKNAVVFYPWKGLQCIRSYVIPANPRTQEQTKNRDKFKFVSYVAQSFNFYENKNLWSYLDKYNIAFNAFMHYNMQSITQPNDFQNILTSYGNLEPIYYIEWIRYNKTNKRLTFKWKTTTTSTGKPDDKIYAILLYSKNFQTINEKQLFTILIDGPRIRSDSTCFIITPTLYDINYMHCFLSVFRDPSTSNKNVSISKYKKPVIFP